MAGVFVATLFKLLPDFFRISASIIMLVGPLFSLLQPPGTASIGLSISTITKSAFSHQRVAAKTKSPRLPVAAELEPIYIISYLKFILFLTVFTVYMCFCVPDIHSQLKSFKTAKYTVLILFEGAQDHFKVNFQLGSSEILLKYLPFPCNCSKKQTYSKCISMGFSFILQKFPRVRPVEATAGHPESFYLNLTTWTTLYKKRVFQTTPFGGNFYGSLIHTHFVYIALVRQSLM